jgi:hypothetical protein
MEQITFVNRGIPVLRWISSEVGPTSLRDIRRSGNSLYSRLQIIYYRYTGALIYFYFKNQPRESS